MTNIRTNTKVTNMELTPEISEYLDKRLQSLEKLIDNNDTSAIFDVEIGKSTQHHQSGNIFRAEINLHIAGKQLRAVAEEETLNNAIDRARDEMMRELRKNKRKRLHLLKRSGARIKGFAQYLGARGSRIRRLMRRRK